VNLLEDPPSNLPPNVRVVASAPQLAVLRRAHLMLTEGGSNSVKECVHFGVPMLVYPRNADQPGNSARVVFHGLGLRGDPKHDSPADMAVKVVRLLGAENCKPALTRVRAEFLDYDSRNVDVVQLEHRMLP
jgi:UDP:flavonoid glycosyltransferase YjiC (YdhE family)